MAALSPRTFYVITSRGDSGPHSRSELRDQLRAGTVKSDDRVRNAFGRPLGTVTTVLADTASGRTSAQGLSPVGSGPMRRVRVRPSRAPWVIGVVVILACIVLLLVGRTFLPVPPPPDTSHTVMPHAPGR